MTANKALMMAKPPVGFPIPGEDLIITETSIDLSSAPPGGLILKTNCISYDPYMRGRMLPIVNSYVSGFKIGEPLNNNAISTVIKSDNSLFKEGDIVIGNSNFQEYVVISKERADMRRAVLGDGFSILENPLRLDPRLFLGALGMSGLTAYSSFYEIGKPKKGETIFISAASGAVGQIVGQLAKHEGLKVLGSVGSDEKLKFITEELGFDGGFNYKTERPDEALKRLLAELGSTGVDVYYDNVGGEQLDASILAMSNYGRIVACGSVSQTSKKPGQTHSIANFPAVVRKRLTIRGFIVSDPDMGPKYAAEHQQNLQQWIKDGTFKVKLSVTEGIDNAAEGLVGMLKGENFGKALLKIADF